MRKIDRSKACSTTSSSNGERSTRREPVNYVLNTRNVIFGKRVDAGTCVDYYDTWVGKRRRGQIDAKGDNTRGYWK